MATVYDRALDQERTADLEQKLQQMLNQGGLSLMISVGHRVGLFDVMGNMDSATSQEIAERSGLRERCVRDWLSAMVHGGIVEYETIIKTYRLPSEHAALLTRSAGLNNYASTARWISIFGKIEDDLVECFRKEGSIPCTVFSSLQSELVAENSVSVVNGLFRHVLPLAPSLILGLCEGLDVLDLGCGAGATLMELAVAFPKSRFVGYDMSEEDIRRARRSAEARGISNITFITRDISQIHAICSFDLITAFDVIHDQAYPFQILDEIHTALRPAGILLMQNPVASHSFEKQSDHPLSPLLSTISCLRSMAFPAEQDLAPAVTEWGEEKTCQTLEEIGFENVAIHQLPHDMLSYFYVAIKQAE
tara:strand:+ start:2321 stop:3409 length:1089 start_codon:yes stop_codon:yes gene_type:complete